MGKKIADIFIFKEIIKNYINFSRLRGDLYYLYAVIKQMGTGSKLLDCMKYKRPINHFSVPIFVGIKKKSVITWCFIFVFIKYDSLFWQISTKTFRFRLKLYLLCVELRNRRKRLAEELTVLRLPTRGSLARRRRWLRYECLSDLGP